MSLSVGVMDLDHDGGELPVNTAEIEACRIEHVAQNAKVRDQRDAAVVEIDAACPQVGSNVAWQVDGWVGQMVGVTE